MTGDAEGRLAYLAESVAVLWPEPDGRRRVVLPTRRAPRVLVPGDAGRAAAAAVRAYTAQLGATDRAAGVLLATAVRAGVGRMLPRVTSPASGTSAAAGSDTIDAYLEGMLGEPVLTSLAITRARPNRKPVLQVFDRSGQTLAFAKVGVSRLAAQLVDAEASALATLEEFAQPAGPVRVPRVLHHGRWHGYPVLVMSALPSGRATTADDPLLKTAMRNLAQVVAGDASVYVAGLRARAAAAPSDTHLQTWRELFDRVLEVRGTDDVPMGAWHGDWTQWNCARTADTIVVWDWERFAHPVPLGFDRLHFVLNSAVGPRRDRFPAEAERLVAQSDELLMGWTSAPGVPRTVALLYVLDLALRYLTDTTRVADVGGAVEQWAFPTVRAALAATTTERGPRR